MAVGACRLNIGRHLLADVTLLVALVTPDPDTSDHRAFVILAGVNLAGQTGSLAYRPPDTLLGGDSDRRESDFP